MSIKTLTGSLFETMLNGGAANLDKNIAIVNDLNVFPIPDGDTGENMSLTLNGGLHALHVHHDESLSETALTVSSGMLMSARGNSGVILSQFFSGLAVGFSGIEAADLPAVGEAFRCAVRSAYASVVTPTEGTILTVARESVEYAACRITGEATLESFMSDLIHEMKQSLKRTPDLLPVLKEAGVIDSGGAGLYYIMDGMQKALRGEKIAGASVTATAPKAQLDTSKFNEDSVMEFGYCTEFLLQLTHHKTDISAFSIDNVIAHLESMGGNSIVAVQTGTIVKIHVHTFTPGDVLSWCQQFGEFLTIKVENMALQHTEVTIENRFEDDDDDLSLTVESDTGANKPFGLVTVATGEGIRQTLRDLGADIVIDGGQGKNPSTEDFITAFKAVRADTIFVLPNNGNIVMAAKQAAELYHDADIRVVESKSIGEGYAALTMLDYDSGDADTIQEDLTSAMGGVTTGLVTKAVRTTTVDGISIRENDYIGFTGKKMLVSKEDALTTATDLCEILEVSTHEYVIVIYGKDATAEEQDAFRGYMKTNHRRTELCEIEGGQDVYHFILIVQ